MNASAWLPSGRRRSPAGWAHSGRGAGRRTAPRLPRVSRGPQRQRSWGPV